MGLSERLSRYAVRRAHVLVVEVPGAWVARARLEGAVIERGWRLAQSPADADVLAVCGVPGPELTTAIERLWGQLPGPRVRVEVRPAQDEDVAAALEAAEADLADTEQHRRDARSRLAEPEVESSADEGMDHGDMDHEDMNHGDMNHGDMDHGDMEMAPGGIPLAEGDNDRDGLEMDVLHLRLGPVLTHWPAGLVLRCTLQGDVITAAEGRLIDDDHPDHEETGGTDEVTEPALAGATAYRDLQPLHPAWRCDNVARMLALAGWEDAAGRARQLRDAQLASTAPAEIAESADKLRRQVIRSRSLRWSLRGLRPLTVDELHAHGLPEQLQGDTYDRLIGMLDRLSGSEADQGEGHDVSPEAISSVVVGLDLGTARLVVASLDLPPVPAHRAVTHA